MADADLLIKVATQPKDPFADVKDSLDDVEKKSFSVSDGFGKITGALAGVAALAGTFDFILDATREMEDLQTQFIAFTGSAAGAADQMERLTAFASKSPFSLADVANANKTLLAFGSSTTASLEQLRQLGEVSAATGKDLGDLATIFGQIQAEGKLTGERFGQLIERGVNLGPEIAKSMGIAETAVKQFTSEGKVSAEVVAAAFRKMTSEGGQFFGSTERMAGTVSGSISSLTDNVSILASTVGTSAVPAFSSLVNIISKAVEGNIAYLKEQQKIANENEAQKRIRSIGEEVSELTETLTELKQTQSEGFKFFGDDQLELTDKIDQVTLSIRNLSMERLKLIKQEGMSETLKRDADAAAELAKQQNKADDERKAKLKEAAAAQDAIQAKADEDKKKKIAETEKQINDLRTAEQSIGLQRETLLIQQQQERNAEAEKKAAADALLREREKAEGLFILRSEAELADEARELETNERRRTLMLEAVNARESELTAARTAAEASRQELLGQFESAEVTRAQETQRKITETQKKAEADRMGVIRKAQKDQWDIAATTTQAQKQWDEQTYAQRLATAQTGLNALAGLMKSKNREAFEIGKAAAIAQALVAIPATAIDAYKSLAGVPLVGPALGAAAAAAAVVAGMEQVRTIQSQRLALAEGGIVPGVGNKDTVPALLTPGEVVVPKKNFGDLQDSFVRGAVADDQVMLLQAGNNIQMRILDTLTYGTVGEKLTSMLAAIERVRDAVSSISISSGTNTEAVKEATEEIERQQPQVEPSGRGNSGGGRVNSRTKNQ
jgi:tape measure domain-containing protein